MAYKEYKGIDYAAVSADVLEFWKKNQIFEKSITTRKGKPTFVFYEGPPSANGTPGIHHVMARTVKDIFCRYKTLQGFQVNRKAGWDTHGLPVELQVEKELGITKEDIGTKITVAEYNQKCREAVMRFTAQWNELTEKIGFWLDLDNPYITYENEYIESLWWLLSELHKKELLYKGYTIQPYSPAAGTGLSSHELNLPGCYKEVKDLSLIAQFKLTQVSAEKSPFANFAQAPIYILAWTTTPWTLPSNAALAVGEKIEYVLVETVNQYSLQPIQVVLAKDLLSKYFTEETVDMSKFKSGNKLPYNLLATCKGKELVGLYYEQLMPYVQPEGDAFRVIAGDFVTTTDGTGIVHIAPTFGADDKRAAEAANIPAILVTDSNGKKVPLVDKQGKFVAEVTDFAGKFVKNEYYADAEMPDKSVDVEISILLKQQNKCFDSRKYEHTYPHCWRTDKPILYYPLESWFIKTTAFKDKLVALNKKINWKPASTGEGRFGNWLENLVDWNLSRSRYWGTPLPIWRTEDGSHEICIASTQQLLAEIEKANIKFRQCEINDKSPYCYNATNWIDNNLAFVEAVKTNEYDLHRPYIDHVTLVAPNGMPMFRELDLIDVWFDSGAMPYAQWHYPFTQQSLENVYPADFIAEGVDQTRGWFFTLHAIAVMLFDSVAFKNVISNGLVLDKNGNKMSKRLGNAVNPFEVIEKYGTDAVRWYMISNAAPWENLKFNEEGIVEAQRKFFGTLQNTYNFFALYANLDQFVPNEKPVPLQERAELDRWIISSLHTLIAEVETAYQDYEPHRAARAIQDFIGEKLSNWYVRLSRRRFWKGEMTENKKAAYQTLYDCLITTAQLMSPIAPFYAEFLYQNLTTDAAQKEESVHLTTWQSAEKAYIDSNLEQEMALAQQICSMIHALRKKDNLRVRLPLSRILIPVLNPTLQQQIEAVAPLIQSETNIKHIEFVTDDSGVVVKKIKANFKVLGKKLGAKMKEAGQIIATFGQDTIREIEKTGKTQLTFQDGNQIELIREDVEITSEDIPGWSVLTENGITVALDVQLTDELQKEGIARDLVNRIQNIRKEMGLEVQDKITIQLQSVSSNALANAAFQTHQDYICTETQALSLTVLESVPNGKVIEMEDFELVAAVVRQ
jgi:isoleucyl-tRNA synthetase